MSTWLTKKTGDDEGRPTIVESLSGRAAKKSPKTVGRADGFERFIEGEKRSARGSAGIDALAVRLNATCQWGALPPCWRRGRFDRLWWICCCCCGRLLCCLTLPSIASEMPQIPVGWNDRRQHPPLPPHLSELSGF